MLKDVKHFFFRFEILSKFEKNLVFKNCNELLLCQNCI